jgi:hypothetical protein
MLIFETVINRYLAQDPEMLDKLASFTGKVIKLEITGINKVLYLFPDNTGIRVRTEHEGPVDTVLRGTPISLFKMGLVSNAANLLLKGEVEISGDTRLGHQFKNAFSQTGRQSRLPGAAIGKKTGSLGCTDGEIGLHELQRVPAGRDRRCRHRHRN